MVVSLLICACRLSVCALYAADIDQCFMRVYGLQESASRTHMASCIYKIIDAPCHNSSDSFCYKCCVGGVVSKLTVDNVAASKSAFFAVLRS